MCLSLSNFLTRLELFNMVVLCLPFLMYPYLQRTAILPEEMSTCQTPATYLQANIYSHSTTRVRHRLNQSFGPLPLLCRFFYS
jgi:hypothetical protein